MSEQTIELSSNLNDLRVDRISQFWGLWAIDPTFINTLSAVGQVDLESHVLTNEGMTLEKGDQFERLSQTVERPGADKVAVVRISGPMSKRGSSMNRSGGTIRARNELRQAVADKSIESILMVFDTPGGTVAGTKELADDIHKASQTKRVVGFGEDFVGSAGYYAFSQCPEKVTNEAALVGSIGTFMSITDSSGKAEKSGLKVTTISTGKFKGMGTPGTQVTDEQIAYLQGLAHEQNKPFLSAIERGTGLNAEQVNQLADGRVHTASAAADLGLIDGVSSFDNVVDALISNQSLKGESLKNFITVPGGKNDPAQTTTAETNEAVETNAADVSEDTATQVSETDANETDATQNSETNTSQNTPESGDSVTETSQTENASEASQSGDLAQFVAEFGSAKGAEYLLAGFTLNQAKAVNSMMQTAAKVSAEKITQLEATVEALKSSEGQPLSSGGIVDGEYQGGEGFASNVKV